MHIITTESKVVYVGYYSNCVLSMERVYDAVPFIYVLILYALPICSLLLPQILRT